jgi:hypothetical protein
MPYRKGAARETGVSPLNGQDVDASHRSIPTRAAIIVSTHRLLLVPPPPFPLLPPDVYHGCADGWSPIAGSRGMAVVLRRMIARRDEQTLTLGRQET